MAVRYGKTQQTPEIWSRDRYDPSILRNLLRDTSLPVLAFLAEESGLHRIPGLSPEALINRMLEHLPVEGLSRLRDELIAARYGHLPLQALLEMALEGQHIHEAAKPRLDQISPSEAILLESGPPRWVYTMRSHDQSIDLKERTLTCDCRFFLFASRHQALCKHLAMAFWLIPETYAREILIDLLVLRQYGGKPNGGWYFDAFHAA